MNELALFAGAGGGLLASKHLLGWRTVCYVEKNPYRVEVLKARIRDGLLDDAPIWDDVETFDGQPWCGSVDIITAGFPCQPYSLAGARKKEGDPRNGWPATIRIIREVQPRYCLLENVAGLLYSDYFGKILWDLAESGFNCRWDCIPASAIGANHQRDRVFIIVSNPNRLKGELQCFARKQNKEIQPTWDGKTQQMANTHKERCSSEGTKRGKKESTRIKPQSGWGRWWETEPNVARVADGLAHRVDRCEALGDGQVPGVVASVWRLLNE